MASEMPQPDSEPSDEAWREIEALVDQIAQLSKAELSSAEFYAEFLPRAVSGLAALGGVVWARGPSGDLAAQYQLHPPDRRLLDSPAAQVQHGQLAAQVLDTGQPRLLLPRSEAAGDDPLANPTEFLLLLCPWRADSDSAGVVEVFQRPGASPKAQRGYLRFLEVVCELVADFHRQRELRAYRHRAAQWGHWQQYLEAIHHSLRPRATAFAIANEGRRLIGCDRLSVLVRRGSRYRLLAVSGVDTFNRRAGVVRPLEKLAGVVAVLDEPLWHPGRAEDRPPEVDPWLSAYLDESHARALAVLPLQPPRGEADERASRPAPVGVLVAERFSGALDEGFRATVREMGGQAALALRNALEADSVPLAGLLRAVGRAGWSLRASQLPKTLLALVAVAAAVAALILVPAELRIEARGELQPLATRDVFAPTDAVVAEVRVAHGERVGAGEVVLVLRKPELDVELKRVGGELQTARKKLKAAEAEQLLGPRQPDAPRRRPGELTAQQEELRERIAGLEQQLAILQQKQSELAVRSPMAGEVLTWNLHQLLEARPVSRGQVLMTVADLEGPWVLELRIADHRVAHVLAAREHIRPNLDVSFVLATEPGLGLWGELERVGMRTEVTEADGAFVLARVAIDSEHIPERLPGATVTAKIHCGRRALGYVWLHELIDAVRSWFLF